LFTKIIHNKLQQTSKHIIKHINEDQNDFNPDRECDDSPTSGEEENNKRRENMALWPLLKAEGKKHMTRSPGIDCDALCESTISIIAS